MKGWWGCYNWISKKDIIWMSKYFLEPKCSGGVVKVELNLSNFPTKPFLNDATGVDTAKFAKRVDWESLKSNVDKLDICVRIN